MKKYSFLYFHLFSIHFPEKGTGKAQEDLTEYLIVGSKLGNRLSKKKGRRNEVKVSLIFCLHPWRENCWLRVPLARLRPPDMQI